MRCIAIRRRATLYQVLALTLAFFLGVHAAGHTTHNEAPPAGGSAAGSPHPTVSIEEPLGEIHSAVVHFPIAMLLSAALSEVLLAATARPSFRHVTRFLIWIAALGAVSAAPLGWLAAATVEDVPERLLACHRWLGVSTAVWSLATLWASEHAAEARAFLRLFIACAALLVAVTGYLGGEVVHNAQAWAEGVR